MKISVNASGCGRGKSYDNKQFIKKNKTKKFLIIVPSISLANEYSELAREIHSENGVSTDVATQIITAITNNVKSIVITQKSFLDFNNKAFLCKDRIVLQDEHIDPFSSINLYLHNHSNWMDMFEITATEHPMWYSVSLNRPRINEFLNSLDTLDSADIIKDLLSTSSVIYTNNASISKDSVIFRVLSPDMYEGATSVHIACANFTANKQYHLWTNMFDVEFEVIRPFVKYETPNTTIHMAEQDLNTKSYNRKDPSIRNAFIQYVNEHTNELVYIDNNEYKDIPMWTRLTHNCHGVNRYSEIAHIAIMSAINYNAMQSYFLRDFAHMTDMKISESMIGEIAHQVIMRGSLRSKNGIDRSMNKCDIYVMDRTVAAHLDANIFNGCSLSFISNTERTKQERLTTMESRKVVAIQRHPDHKAKYEHMDAREIMKDFIWTCTNTNGNYTPEYKKALKAHQKRIRTQQ